jgi:methyl-accepting chemotaxis protein
MTQQTDFSKFVPGLDLLQNFAKGAGLGGFGNWVAPTLNVEELEKRINELKVVNFWLEQNSRALSATIQALEVQKMTLSTLKDMNLNIGDMAKNLHTQATEATEQMTAAANHATQTTTQAATQAAQAAQAAHHAVPPVVDPLQLWNALAGQFQQIASTAFKADPATESTKPKARATTRKKATE